MAPTSELPAQPATSLTDTQLLVLSQASQRDDLRIILPARLKGIIAEKVLSTLALRGLSEPFVFEASGFGEAMPGLTDYRISAGGLLALGVEPDSAKAVSFKDSDNKAREVGDPVTPLDAVMTEGPATRSAPAHSAPSQPRLGSKLDHVIRMLMQPEGCSMDELTQKTGWLTHTTRAALTGLRKRGHVVVCERGGSNGSRYLIIQADHASMATSAGRAA